MRNDERLVDLIYAATLGETSWQAFLDALNDGLPDGRSTFFFHDAAKGRGGLSLTAGIGEDQLDVYNRHYSSVNPWMARAAVRPVGTGVVSDQMLEPDNLRRTEFYNDFMRPMRSAAAVGVTIVREQGRSLLLSTLTSEADSNRNALAAQQLTRLAPHLKRAFRYYHSDVSRRTINQVGLSIFEGLEIGLAIVGPGSMPGSISSKAQLEIERGRIVGLSPVGRLYLVDKQANAVLEHMTDRLGSGPRAHGYSVVEDGVAFRITLIKVTTDSASMFFAGPTVAITIEETRSSSLEGVAAKYGLSPAEMRIVTALNRGLTVRQAASENDIAEATARQQLKAVFGKMGVRRQAELIVRLRAL